MKPTIKSLWAQYKDEQLVLKELKNISTTPYLLNRWSEYAIANNMSKVFEWISEQLPKHESYNALRLEQASVYNRTGIVEFLLRHDPHVAFNRAIAAAASRGHMLVLETIFEHIKNRHEILGDTDKILEEARFAVAKSACEGRKIEVLQHYLPFHPDYNGKWVSSLMAICAEKNFTVGLMHFLQWGEINDWERIVGICSQPHALQKECLLVLLDNIPSNLSQHSIQRCAGDALQRLVTLTGSKFDHPDNAVVLKALTQHISFEDFIVRKSGAELIRKNQDALQDIWRRVQRDTIMKNIEVSTVAGVKRKI